MVRCLLLCTIFALAAAVAHGAEPAAHQPDARTVLLLHLDGDGKDASICAADAFPQGEMEWVDGRFGKALKLKGRGLLTQAGTILPNGMPSMLAGPGALSAGEGSLTLECWARPEPTQGASTVHILAVNGGSDQQGAYGFLLHVGMLSAYFSAGDGAAARATPEANRLLHDGQWHHLAAVLDRDNAGEIRIYLDGRNVTAKPARQRFPVETPSESGAATLGYYGFVTQPFANGYRGAIDEVRLSRGVREAYRRPEPLRVEAPVPAPVPDPNAAGPLTLGPDATVIALSAVKGPLEDSAAQLLQSSLRSAYAVKTGFEIVPADRPLPAAAKVIIAIGWTSWSEGFALSPVNLGRYGFRIHRVGNIIAIAGDKSRGTYYGVIRFLDRFCGVRFYMPGDLWTSRPAKVPLILDNVDMLSKPAVQSTFMTGVFGTWVDQNAVSRRVGGTHQHNMLQIFPPERFAQRWPEIYPILPVKTGNAVERKRVIPGADAGQGWQPCFSEPRLVDAAEESILAYFTRNPTHDFIAVSVNDSHAFCECDRCLKLIAEVGGDKVKGYTRMYLKFLNALAVRVEARLPETGATPGKRIVYIVYSEVSGAPEEKLHPSILPVIVTKFYDIPLGMQFSDPKVRLSPDLLKLSWQEAVTQHLHPEQANDAWSRDFWARMDAFNRNANGFGHHFWHHGMGYLIPYNLFTGPASAYFQLARERNLQYVHMEAYPSFGMQGPVFYILARLFWDPGVDVAALWREFAVDMFGEEAAGHVVDYFTTLERLPSAYIGKPKVKMGLFANQLLLQDDAQRELYRAARRHLDAARPKLRTDEQKKRFELFDKSFKLTEMLLALHSNREPSQADLQAIRDYTSQVILKDPMALYLGRGTDSVMANVNAAIGAVTQGRKIKPAAPLNGPKPGEAP